MAGGGPPGVRQRGRARPRQTVWQGAALAALVALVAIAALGLGAVAVAATPHGAQTRAMNVGIDVSAMQNAVNAAGWPQQQHNWCGVAAIAAVASYVNGGSVSQGSVAAFLSSDAAKSTWGTPTYIYPGPAFQADIARDAGTDPRAIARGQGAMTGGLYHNIVDNWGAFDATFHLAVDLRDYHQPITVIVDGGQHSVVVSRIYANDDPVANPGSIYALDVWDPGFGAFDAGIQSAQYERVPIWAWYNDYVYWGSIYDDFYDPDPSVGVYAGKQLWTWNRVYIRPWGLNYVSADWALNQWGDPIPGLHGEYPPGYTPPTPTPTPTPTATPTPLPIRLARAAPTLAATAAQQSATDLTSATATATTVTADIPLAAPAVNTPAPMRGWCAGPYCLIGADLPWWGASLACVLLLAGLWGAIFTRARRATGPPPE